MRKFRTASVALAIGAMGLLMAGGVTLARDAMTLHLEVSADSNKDKNVTMTMPLDLVAAMASSIDSQKSVTNEIFEGFSDEGFDLRKFWQQVKEGNINEFFNMAVKEAKIRAWRSDGMFRLTVDATESDERFGGHEHAKVEINVPEELMDMLVAADGDVPPEKLVATLRAMGPMTLVEVKTDEERVRIWLD